MGGNALMTDDWLPPEQQSKDGQAAEESAIEAPRICCSTRLMHGVGPLEGTWAKGNSCYTPNSHEQGGFAMRTVSRWRIIGIVTERVNNKSRTSDISYKSVLYNLI